MATIIVKTVSVKKWEEHKGYVACIFQLDDFEIQCKGKLMPMRIIRGYLCFRENRQFKMQLLTTYMARVNVQAKAIPQGINGLWKAWLFNRCYRQEQNNWLDKLDERT